jgi:hypothetical protein
MVRTFATPFNIITSDNFLPDAPSLRESENSRISLLFLYQINHLLVKENLQITCMDACVHRL